MSDLLVPYVCGVATSLSLTPLWLMYQLWGMTADDHAGKAVVAAAYFLVILPLAVIGGMLAGGLMHWLRLFETL